KIAERLAMIDGRITAVVFPAVAGVLHCELRHEAVARDLRDDRRCSDRERFRVAPHDLRVPSRGERRIEDATPVDEDPVVLADLAQRAQHRNMTRVIDVEAMDLRERRGTDADLYNSAADRIEKPFALETRQDLRIVDLADEPRVRRDQACRRDHRTRESRHADLVDADNTQEALCPQALLII